MEQKESDNIVMTTVPKLTRRGGTLPITFLTFSLLNSMLSDSFSFCSISKVFLVSQFQLILHKIIVCPSLGGQRLMVAFLNHFSMVDDHDLVGILHRA